MALDWARKKILIWGKTRPELSKSYREIVCTGGVFEEDKRLVRLYPVPLRYIDDEKVFRKYQWIEASVAKAPEDVRPESFKIMYDDIEVLEYIPTQNGNWDNRARWIIQPQNIYQSVEELKARWKQDHTSLGLVKPARVHSVKYQKLSDAERDYFWRNYKQAVAQMDLPLDDLTKRPRKPLTPPDFRFRVRFKCDEPQCDGHIFSPLDWEIDALYFKLKESGHQPYDAATKVVEKIRDQICAPDKDLYFYLGNISTHPQVFTIVGFWWPKKSKQPRLPKLT